jgi:hypothetical protein
MRSSQRIRRIRFQRPRCWPSAGPDSPSTLALDAPSLYYVREHHNPRHESVLHSRRVIQQRHLDPDTGAARIDVITVSERGRIPRAYYQQLYRVDEIKAMLTEADFAVADVLEAEQGPQYRTNAGHVLLVARRR